MQNNNANQSQPIAEENLQVLGQIIQLWQHASEFERGRILGKLEALAEANDPEKKSA